MAKYKKEIILEICKALKSYGYAVYISKTGEHGFYTDGASVVSFGGQWEFSADFSGNYGPPSRQCGTGWQIAAEQCIPTEEQARAWLNALPPTWATNGANVRKTSPEQHLSTYGKSSGYVLFECR